MATTHSATAQMHRHSSPAVLQVLPIGPHIYTQYTQHRAYFHRSGTSCRATQSSQPVTASSATIHSATAVIPALLCCRYFPVDPHDPHILSIEFAAPGNGAAQQATGKDFEHKPLVVAGIEVGGCCVAPVGMSHLCMLLYPWIEVMCVRT